MLQKFSFKLHDGHLILEHQKDIILLDTGAPMSIHMDGSINFLDTNYECDNAYQGLDTENLSELLGLKVNCLMGTDILSNYHILFDYKNLMISFSDQMFELKSNFQPISDFMGIPILELEIDGDSKRLFLDTGAKISYISHDISASFESLGSKEDFYPGIGKFQTPIYKIPSSIGKDTFDVSYGNLPEMMQMALMLGDVDGIIGFDFFSQFKIALDLKGNNLQYTRYE